MSPPNNAGVQKPEALSAETNSTEHSAMDNNNSSNRDVEAGERTPAEKIDDTPKDVDLVTWDGPDDPEDPKNWPASRKWRVTVVVSLFTFISPIGSSMIAPALDALGRDLGMTKDIEIEMALSIFVLGYAIGPLLFGPLSEMFGRSRVLQCSNFFFFAWNLGCGFAKNPAELFVCRFFAGIGGSAPLSVGGGVLGDIWKPEQRGKAIGIYTLGPILGPAVGPIAAGFVAERSTWRWVFWSTSIVAFAVQLAGMLWLPESYAVTLLRRKRARLVKATGNANLHTEHDDNKSLGSRLGSALVRPARMLATQPIVQMVALYMAYLFGITYLIAVAYTPVWQDVYHERVEIAGLNFISLAIGAFLAIALTVSAVDKIYKKLKARNGDVGLPEFRIPAMFLGAVLVPIGLFWFGWSVEARVHWVMPNIGVMILTGGTMICLQGMQGYMIDTYRTYAASGMAAAVVLRSLAGFAFPLFAPYLYQRLGYGWGSSVLAFISIGIGIPAPILFYLYGGKLRAMSKYAAD